MIETPPPPFSSRSSASTTSFTSSPLPTGDKTLTLIPRLPNDVAALILSFVPYPHHSRLKSTCKAWRVFFSSKSLISLRQLHRHLSHLLCVFPQDPSIASPYLFDPQSLAWCPLPRMPCNPHVYGLCNFTSISIGHHLYVIGGSVFDTRSFPMDRPSPSSSTFRFHAYDLSWECLAPMLSPRGSFACAAVPDSNQIFVAGGGSRHTLFGAAGSRIRSVERYDIGGDKWIAMDGLPRFRAGCVGFFVGNGKEESMKFWVMAGYGDSRTIAGVLPVDEYYQDAVVMELKNGSGVGTWREIGNMWGEGERMRIGKIVVVEEEDRRGHPEIFMLDGNEIFRYDMALNRWLEESYVPKKAPHISSSGVVALDGELYVLSHLKDIDLMETRRSQHQKRAGMWFIQIYNPKKRTWRSLVSKSPFHDFVDFNAAVLCTIRL